MPFCQCPVVRLGLPHPLVITFDEGWRRHSGRLTAERRNQHQQSLSSQA